MVTAAERSVQKILEGSVQYQVPLYQRPYQWDTKEWGILWEDLVDLTRSRRESPELTHFIGSLVLAPHHVPSPGGLQNFLVVDGQQRLTTLSVLLAALRDAFDSAAEARPKTAEKIHNQLLVNQYEDEPLHHKLVPTQVDRSAFRNVINRVPEDREVSLIVKSYRYFTAQINKLEDDVLLSELESAITQGLSLVSISTETSDNVHRIFQSLNNTGLKLTQGDLLRNYYFMRLPTLGPTAYEKLWLPMQRRLDSSEIESLFWNDCVHRDHRIKQDDVFVTQQSRLERLTSEADIYADLERIAAMSKHMRILHHPSEEPDPGVRARLVRLKDWASTTTAPLIIYLLMERADKGIDNHDLARALLYIESYLVRRLVAGRSTQGLNRIFAQSVSELARIRPQTPGSIATAWHRYLSTGRKHYATDEEIRAAAQTVPLYHTGRAAHRKLFMTWLEESFVSNERIDPSTLTIEHIMPQTLNNDWRSDLQRSSDLDDVDDLHTRLVHTLGNLTLTGHNSAMGNRSFLEKRAEYQATGIRLSRELANQDQWGPLQIGKRAASLAEAIISQWPGPIEGLADRDENPMWDRLDELMRAIPVGYWTTYKDLADAIGSAPQPVGNRIATVPVPFAYRVLQAGGQHSPGFAWFDNSMTESPRSILESEGVRFNDSGIADPAQRLASLDLLEAADTISSD